MRVGYSFLFQTRHTVSFPLQMGSSALLDHSIDVPLRPSPMHLERDRMPYIRHDVLSPTPKRPHQLPRKPLRTRSPEVHGSNDQPRPDRPEVHVHERDRFVIGGVESLVCVEAGGELADVCFGGDVERDSWHCCFVAG